MTLANSIKQKKIDVLDSVMAFRELGSRELGRSGQETVLFLHGNPTSSYIWRHIMPGVSSVARGIAPDLIGFGDSGKPDIAYRFADHIRYLDSFIEQVLPERFYMVAQDWGTALAFNFAARYPERVLGLAFMEFMRPLPRWEDFHSSPATRELFRKFRTPGEGEALVLEHNAFIEKVLPGSILRSLQPEEMAAYRAPFSTPESRRPVLAFPRELPIAGEPADVYALIEANDRALRASRYPKLIFSAQPGVVTPPAVAEAYARELHDCRWVRLGEGKHYLQEDHPQAIAQAVADWISSLQH